MAKKVYVGVNVYVGPEGKTTPKSIIWEDGKVYEITDVSDIRKAASKLLTGCGGLRYTCTVHGKPRYLFFEGPAWFVEGRS